MTVPHRFRQFLSEVRVPPSAPFEIKHLALVCDQKIILKNPLKKERLSLAQRLDEELIPRYQVLNRVR